jgi:hypothetical protein
MSHMHLEMGGSAGAGRLPPFAGSWRGAAVRRWHPMELVAMIVGFVIFWPAGLAILAWKKWTGATPGERNVRHGAELERNTGNSAFEDFKRAELARLEDERRKLVDAQAEFGDFLDRLKRARDREEFERFMTERRGPAGQPA